MPKQKPYLKPILVFIATVVFIGSFNFNYAHASSVSEKELGNLLNQEREIRNLNTLNYNFQLYQAALAKAQNMINENYFNHYSPSGKSPWNFIINSGYDYKFAGENLAMDFSSSEALHSAWMKSPSHRDNILNPNYENFAIAKLQGEINHKKTMVIVQLFGKKDQALTSKINTLLTTVTNYLLGYQSLFQ